MVMPPGLSLAGKESQEHRPEASVFTVWLSHPCSLSAESSQCRQGVRQWVTWIVPHRPSWNEEDELGDLSGFWPPIRTAGEVLGLDVLGIYLGVFLSIHLADSLTVSGI